MDDCLVCIADSRPHRITSAKCRTNPIVSPDYGHIVAQNMYRKEINILRKIVHQIGFIYKIKPTDRPTNSVQQSPSWKALSCTRNAHHFVRHEWSLLCPQQPTIAPILSQMNTIRALSTFLCIILQCMPRSSKWPLSSAFSLQKSRMAKYERRESLGDQRYRPGTFIIGYVLKSAQ